MKKKSLDTLTNKTLPTQVQTIAMEIRVHAQEWLTLIFKVSGIDLIQSRKTTKHATHTSSDKKNTTTNIPKQRPQSGRYQEKTIKRKLMESGGGIKLLDLAYEGSGVLEYRKDGPIAQPV
jgi:hypothetical protein